MNINREGYAREPFKITAVVQGERMIIGYTRSPKDDAALRAMETEGWRDVKYEDVRNRRRGDG